LSYSAFRYPLQLASFAAVPFGKLSLELFLIHGRIEFHRVNVREGDFDAEGHCRFSIQEQRQGVQPIGNVLVELLARYGMRLPHLSVMVVLPQRSSEAGQR
jgi:hypothetical protein